MTAVSVLCGYSLKAALMVVLGAGGLGQEIRFRPIRSAPWIWVCDGDGTTSCTVDGDCAGPDGRCIHVPPAVGTIGSELNASFNGTCWEASFAAGEVEVDIALEATGWEQAAGAPSLGAIQATVVSGGYDNGSPGVLNPKGWPGSRRDGAYQPTRVCTDNADLCSPPFDGTCGGRPMVFCIQSASYVMPVCAEALNAIATPTLNYAWATAAQNNCNDSSGGVFKGLGGLILEVPIDAAGTYLIDLDPDPNNSFMTSGAGTPIPGVVFTPACITLPCQSDGDCGDGLSCTTDLCNQQTFACENDIALGSCLIAGVCYSDGQEDPADSCRFCDTDLSQTDWSNQIEGAACGDQSDVECDGADACDGAGSCLTNLAPSGTACGDPTDVECDGADTCDGLGICSTNIASPGTACGDPTDVECNAADTCDGGGSCLTNIAASGTACGDPTDVECNGADACDGAGSCLINVAPPGTACIDDGNDCTRDTCSAGACTHRNSPPSSPCGDPTDTDCNNPDSCDGAGSCLVNLEPIGFACGDATDTDCDKSDTCDDAGACSENFETAGAVCGDPTDTDCDNPDSCDGSGACVENREPVGTPCGDPATTECGASDTCDGAGACLNNFEPKGAPCGDLASTQCDNPDACDGAGSCLLNPEPAGAACGNPADTDCDDPDACDGSGECVENREPAGTACGDPADPECGNPDTCDGGGLCLDNFEISGTPCGDAADTPCNGADTCDGSGSCLTNVLPEEAPCPNGNFCDGAELCQGGVCQSADPPCDLETDLCDEQDDECDKLGDHDGNSLVTLADFLHWQNCETGPVGGPYAVGCEIFDFEQNGFVDLRDYSRFQEVLTTP